MWPSAAHGLLWLTIESLLKYCIQLLCVGTEDWIIILVGWKQIQGLGSRLNLFIVMYRQLSIRCKQSNQVSSSASHTHIRDSRGGVYLKPSQQQLSSTEEMHVFIFMSVFCREITWMTFKLREILFNFFNVVFDFEVTMISWTINIHKSGSSYNTSR